MNDRSPGRARKFACALLAGLALAASPLSAAAAGEAPALSGVVNINTASAEQLELLPGIGPAKARAILEVREQGGRFASVDELEAVSGIGEAALERLRPYATTSGKTTAQRP